MVSLMEQNSRQKEPRSTMLSLVNGTFLIVKIPSPVTPISRRDHSRNMIGNITASCVLHDIFRGPILKIASLDVTIRFFFAVLNRCQLGANMSLNIPPQFRLRFKVFDSGMWSVKWLYVTKNILAAHVPRNNVFQTSTVRNRRRRLKRFRFL